MTVEIISDESKVHKTGVLEGFTSPYLINSPKDILPITNTYNNSSIYAAASVYTVVTVQPCRLLVRSANDSEIVETIGLLN